MFSMALGQFAAKAGDRAKSAVRGVVLEVARRVIVRSPVDTGRFRHNWRISNGSPDTTWDDVGAPGLPPVPAPTPRVPGTPLGQITYITNNVPYARKLEYGHSSQAPQGMVRLTVVEFAGIVDQVAAEVSRQ